MELFRSADIKHAAAEMTRLLGMAILARAIGRTFARAMVDGKRCRGVWLANRADQRQCELVRAAATRMIVIMFVGRGAVLVGRAGAR